MPRVRKSPTTAIERTDRPTILVVDDERTNRALLRAHLIDTYDVFEASDAANAFEYLRRYAIDLVLLDVMMPHMDGFDACRLIKQAHADSYLPVVLVTALGEQEDRIRGLEAGADDFLTRPVDRNELLLRVRAFVKLKRQDECIRTQLQKLTERDQQIRQQLEELERLARIRRQWAEELEHANQELELADRPDRPDRLRMDDASSYVGRVRAATARMSHLIDDLLDLSRIARGPLERQPLSLTELAREIFEDLRRRDPARRVVVELEDGLTTSADRRLVTIAMENLLGNAWKFTARRDEAHIKVGRFAEIKEAPFYVRDDGAGFNPDYVARLFQPFHRLHTHAEFEGSGIGLATVNRIITRHGGRVWAESMEGRGAAFFFTLGQVP
jgi:two-component system, sensor histidine kinase and response regulator